MNNFKCFSFSRILVTGNTIDLVQYICLTEEPFVSKTITGLLEEHFFPRNLYAYNL